MSLLLPARGKIFSNKPTLPRAGFTGFVLLNYLCYKPRSWHPQTINYRALCITDKVGLFEEFHWNPSQKTSKACWLRGRLILMPTEDSCRIFSLNCIKHSQGFTSLNSNPNIIKPRRQNHPSRKTETPS